MNQYFDELIALLSMLSERCIPKKMDKATTLYEAVQCMQVYSDLTKKPDTTLTFDVGKTTKSSSKAKSPPPCQTDTSLDGLHTVGELLHFFLDAHDAFLLVVSNSGRVLFSTELITSLLGHMQTRLVGQNFFDFVHENDHEIFHEILKSEQSGIKGIKLEDRPIIAFPPKLVHFHMKLYSGETGYMPQYLQFRSIVYLRKWDKDRLTGEVEMSPLSPDPSSPESGYSVDHDLQSCLVVIGKLPTSPSMVDLPMGTNDVNFEFEMRVSKEGRIIDIDKHAVIVLGYTTSDIIGTSFFEYVDPYHLSDISECMSTLLSDGLGTTTPYRLLTKGGRSIWLISKGYLSYNPWNNKPDHILLANRILGCDQVLPEHRFFRSRRLLPDLEGHECYVPETPVRRTSPPPTLLDLVTETPGSVHSGTSSTADSAPVSNKQEKQFNVSGQQRVSHHQHQTSPHQQQVQPVQQPPQYPPQVVNMQQTFPPQAQIPQMGGTEGGQQQILQVTQSTITGSQAQTPVTPAPLQGGIITPGISQQSTSAVTPGFPPSVQPQPSQPIGPVQNFADIQRELKRKNREIFEMQKKLFEQQQLFEKERSQFYSITAQVMQCISSNTVPQLQPNMQMAFTTSSDYTNSGMLNTQSKMVMDSPMPPKTQVPFSSDSVHCTTASLWDSSGPVSMAHEVYSTNSQHFPLQQQMQQTQYNVKPTTSIPVSTGNFPADYVPTNISPSIVSASPMQQHQQQTDTLLSEQFGLSQAFKMSGSQTLTEHNMQFFQHDQQPRAQQQQSGPGRQSQHPHMQQSLSASQGGYGSLMSNDILSNLSSSHSGSTLSLPSLPIAMHSQKPPQPQRSLPSPNLADILNSTRFT